MQSEKQLHYQARITATGHVTFTDPNTPALEMLILQNPYPGSPLSPLCIRGLLPLRSASRRLCTPVPEPGRFLTVTGNVLAIENDIPVIAVDDFSDLTQTSRPEISSLSFWDDENDRDEINFERMSMDDLD